MLVSLAVQGETPVAEVQKLYAVEFRTGPAWKPGLVPPAQPYFKEHSANLQRLRSEGVLVAGARYGEVGLVVLRATSLAAAESQIVQDPAVVHGLFSYQLNEMLVFYPGHLGKPVSPP